MSRPPARDTTARANTRRLFGEDTETNDSVRPGDLIRAQRPREAAWTVFVDDVGEEDESRLRRRSQRNNLVRQRPTAWKVVEKVDEQDKENIGYVVKRPVRRRSLENSHPTATTPATPVRAETSVARTTASRSNGKRKLQSTPPPPPKKTKVCQPEKKDIVEERPEHAAVRQERARRPLEDITHLYVDPTAFYFQPWRRATRIAPRASSMRML